MSKTYTNTWKKYLAVFRIFLKKHLNQQVSFSVNSIDFLIGNREKYHFTIFINNGKGENIPSGSVVGDNLYALLNTDLQCKELLASRKIKIGMNKDFKISIQTY